ncbi:MAG: zinc ABC transporter substrate-binding protein [Candidatus Promineifilaceae bacterium]|nr:zinc ABC transporter substrate-binding protein [Candidatus Promineifilaceae bacterium]
MFTRKLLLSLLILVLVGCASGETQEADDGALDVVATTGMIGDVAANIGGEHVSVTTLMGPGVDPHLYQASAGDVSRLREADIIFYNGLHLEAQMGEVLERMDESDRVTVAVTETINRAVLMTPAEYEGNYDPHVWFDVLLWMEAVEVVRDTLIDFDPEHAADYRENAAAYLAELEALHDYVLERAQEVPAQQRALVTAHDAFNYFGEAYGFEVLGLQGISTEAEASTADVQALARFIAEREIPAIFVESSVPQRNVEAVQAAVQAQGFDVEIGGELFSDALGAGGTPEGTYIGMVRHNIDTIVDALVSE